MDINATNLQVGKEFFNFLADVDAVIPNDPSTLSQRPGANLNSIDADMDPSQAANLFRAATDYNGVLTPDNFSMCRQVWNATTNFFNENNLCAGKNVNYNDMDVVSIESLTSNMSLTNIGASAINSLCDEAGASAEPSSRRALVREIGIILQRMFSYRTPDAYRVSHYTNGRENYNGNLDNYSAMFPTNVLNMFKEQTTMPSMEAFGANIDKVITDSRLTIAITLLRFHKSLLNRFMHRRQRSTTIVEYEVPYAETYDLFKSMADDVEIREGREHHNIFLDLYRNPEPVTQALTPLYPKKENDTKGAVVEDGILAFGVMANLFDLSLDKNKIGQNHIDFTTLVSEGVCLDKLYVTLTLGDKVEKFVINTNKERCVPTAQNRDSSYRLGMFRNRIKLTKDLETSSGAVSEILADCTDSDYLVLDIQANGGIYLKNADTQFMGHGRVFAHAIEGREPSEDIKALAADVKVDMLGYSVYAFYSEENLRTSNTCFRTNKFMRAYEIMCGKNYMVDYSLNQVLPEYVMSIVTEGMSLGMDDRAMKLFEENANLVYDRVQKERADDSYLNHLDRINFEYVAGVRVNPYIYIDTIDLLNIDTIRESDYLSDVRQAVDTRLIRIMSLLHANSLYRQQLEPGEAPTYKLITSNIILENLFAVPHIHNHIEQMEKRESDGEVVEYTRVLPSGVVLQCITSPWDRMRNKIFIAPFRPNFPDSELNYGHNWDYGTFLAHYTPQIANGVNKRLFCNAREQPIITNPTACMLTVAHFDQVINLSYVSGMHP